ncbi:hypothetical protein GCM10022419_095810 [Nonomuraea rosea]|uniref:DUF3040 domain-containing protein n=1 Tax=Nonomuraea rosea TaxID=638574 RepID=A0ABP6Z3M8_9ACTN
MRIVIAVVVVLAMAGVVVSAVLGGLAWGFSLLLVSGGLLALGRLLGTKELHKMQAALRSWRRPRG